MDQYQKSDNELMAEFSTCSRKAFEEIMNRYKKRLLNYLLLGLIKDKDCAEDIVQETLIRVYKSKYTYKATYQFSTWIYTISRRLALNEKRNKHTAPYNGEEPDDNGKSISEIIEEEEFSKIMKGLLQKLDPKYRDVIVLRYIQEMSYDEISKITGIKENTLKSHCKRALEQIRKEMEDEN